MRPKKKKIRRRVASLVGGSGIQAIKRKKYKMMNIALFGRGCL